MGILNIIRYNIRSLTFAKFVELMKTAMVKAGLNVFSYFSA